MHKDKNIDTTRLLLKSILLLVFWIMAAAKLTAQDPHFSQYYASPSTLNPSLLGSGNSDWKISGLYRTQWWGGSIAPYKTTSVSIEKSVYPDAAGGNSWGLGLSVFSDASNAGLLRNNYFNAGAAYRVNLSGDDKNILGLGLSVTYANRILDASKFAFQDQFGSMGFQRTVPTADPVSLLNNHYWDVNTGLYFEHTGNDWGYGIGAALFHAANPQAGVYNSSTYSVSRRAVMHGNVFRRLSGGDQLIFSGLAEWQGKNRIVTMGAVYKLSVGSELVKNVNLGLWNRFNDAWVPYAGLEARLWLLGISYDFVSSGVHTSNNAVQSLEISFGYLFGKHNANAKNNKVIRY